MQMHTSQHEYKSYNTEVKAITQMQTPQHEYKCHYMNAKTTTQLKYNQLDITHRDPYKALFILAIVKRKQFLPTLTSSLCP